MRYFIIIDYFGRINISHQSVTFHLLKHQLKKIVKCSIFISCSLACVHFTRILSLQGFAIPKESQNKVAKLSFRGTPAELRHGDVVIAAITSCTNTSNPSVMLGAALVAKKACELGLEVGFRSFPSPFMSTYMYHLTIELIDNENILVCTYYIFGISL